MLTFLTTIFVVAAAWAQGPGICERMLADGNIVVRYHAISIDKEGNEEANDENEGGWDRNRPEVPAGRPTEKPDAEEVPLEEVDLPLDTVVPDSVEREQKRKERERKLPAVSWRVPTLPEFDIFPVKKPPNNLPN